MKVNIAIVGGGIGGLSAAHHLVDKGFADIHIFEETGKVGGKAKSQTTAGGRSGEHGFRFFPHFYRHVVDTMKHIPSGAGTVWDRLGQSEKGGVAYDGKTILEVARPTDLKAPAKMIKTILKALDRPEINDPRDLMRFARVMLEFATSCDQRRQRDFDDMTWDEFTGGQKFGKDFYQIVIQATRNLAAMRAKTSSANTIATMCLQMIFDFDPDSGNRIDGVLNAPTDESWLRPWREHLEGKQVTFHCGDELIAFEFQEPVVRAVQLSRSGRVEAKRFVCAVPLECIAKVLPAAMKTFDPTLARVAELAPKARGDMVGAQFFLAHDVPILRGHIHFPKAPFGLTAVSQKQFWKDDPGYGVLSVIISDWDQRNECGKAARDFTDRTELLEEVWRQLEAQLPPGTVKWSDVIEMHLDDNVSLDPFVNSTPLLTHPPGQRRLRPRSRNRIENLYLAADYVQTHVDLATMEGADDAARQAVAAIMKDTNTAGQPPTRYPLSEGGVFDLAKAVDLVLWRLKQPHVMKLRSKLGAAALLQKLDGAVGALLDAAVAALPADVQQTMRPQADAIRPLFEILAQQPDLEKGELSEAVLEQWARALGALPPPAIPIPAGDL